MVPWGTTAVHYSTGTRVLVPMATNTSTGTTAPHTHWLSQLLCLMYMYFTVSMATSTSTNFNCSTHYYRYLPHRQTLPQTDRPISTLSLTIYCMHTTCIIRVIYIQYVHQLLWERCPVYTSTISSQLVPPLTDPPRCRHSP